jgi:AcrR family transcriptional regulator
MSEEETRQRILEAAVQLFSERGYDGATTRAIASLAGVNEVTLFRHFGSKKSLFQGMLRHNSALPGLEFALRERLTGDYRQDLLVLATQVLTLLHARRKEIIMLLAEAERRPEMLEMVAFVPMQQRQMVSDYLKWQMAQGRVRPLDPDLATQGLLGMLLSYCLGLNLLPEALRRIPLEEVADQFVDLFVEGTRKQGNFPEIRRMPTLQGRT